MENKTQSNLNLASFFIEYLKYKKNPDKTDIDETNIMIALGTAFGGLDYGFNPYTLILEMSGDFTKISAILDSHSKSAYRNQQVSSGKEDLKSNIEKDQNKPYTVADAAKFLRIGEEAIRKMIRSEKLPAFKIDGKSYRISRQALNNYLQQKGLIGDIEE